MKIDLIIKESHPILFYNDEFELSLLFFFFFCYKNMKNIKKKNE